jgi:type II secretory pathway component GspD/PulD (secretin)
MTMNASKIVLLIVTTLVLLPVGANGEEEKKLVPGVLEVGVEMTKVSHVTLRFEDTDVREVVATIAKAAGRNIVLDPKVVGKVNVALEDVPWGSALEQVVGLVGGRVVEVREGESARVLKIVPKDDGNASRWSAGPTIRYEDGKAKWREAFVDWAKRGYAPIRYKTNISMKKDGTSKWLAYGLVPGKFTTTVSDRLLEDLRAAVPKLRAAGLEKEARAVEQEIARRERQLTSPGEARLLQEVQALRRDVAALRMEVRALAAMLRGGAAAGKAGKAGGASWPEKGK